SSLARPGGNITGLATFLNDIIPKHLELLATTISGLARVAVMINPENGGHGIVLKSAMAAGQQAGLEILAMALRNAEDIERTFEMMARRGAQAIIVVSDPMFNLNAARIARAAMERHLASVHIAPEYARAGGLMSYGDHVGSFYRRAAYYVDRIFKG